MDNSLLLIWIALTLSGIGSLLNYLNLIPKWPNIYIVSFLSNILILGFYYTPSLFGVEYYFLNIVKTAPLIMLLVWLARKDPSPNWSYRALCLVLIMQVMSGGCHILLDLNFFYYDQLSLLATILELIIIVGGGVNVRFSRTPHGTRDSSSTESCSLWAKRHH